jgi:hypothetical protein
MAGRSSTMKYHKTDLWCPLLSLLVILKANRAHFAFFLGRGGMDGLSKALKIVVHAQKVES